MAIGQVNWTVEDDERLCDLVANELPLQRIPLRMNRSLLSVKARWRRVVREMGPQAI
ncbi:hypothetical protein [Sphingomonas paeninsulae]|uniref:hypothetical protein n=1 Tax=Sphingomonas paeninsulae TaxID=2319844 RepID=UPI0013CE8935|nr:hypothetical protein [Sphingomonas paeninsulae]